MMLMWTVMSKMLDRICSVHMLRSTKCDKMSHYLHHGRNILDITKNQKHTVWNQANNSAFKVPDPITRVQIYKNTVHLLKATELGVCVCIRQQ